MLAPDLASVSSPFPETRWSVVLQAHAADETAGREALARLCAAYWYPLYAFARRLGHNRHEAQDLTQGFFLYVIERSLFSSADQRLGRLRTFLLTAFRRFIGDVQARQQALKRGGGRDELQIDAAQGEERYQAEMADRTTPEKLFERSWAYTILDLVLRRLAEEEALAGRAEQFEALKSFLSPANVADESYPQAGARLQLSEEAVRQAVSRLRKRFRTRLREEIAQTLRDPRDEQIAEELASLRAALRG